MKLNTIDLLAKLDSVYPDGFQASVNYGILNLTKAIYKKVELIYLFSLNDEFNFDRNFGYTKNEFTSKYANYEWLIEMTIS